MIRAVAFGLLAVQVPALVALLARLAPGRTRRAPVEPVLVPRRDTSVSVIVATLNEAHRIRPCLDGLTAQVDPLLEILVVDSDSTDGTRDIVESYALQDPRVRLISDHPLPSGWIGKVWALETGLRHARGVWVLGVDADTIPAPGLIGAVVHAVEHDALDVASFGPQFVGQSAGERFVQPAMLTTLVYRCGAPGAIAKSADRVLANGQCFVARRELLVQHGGYAPARRSFSDDVTLARHLAARGARVGFLDGSRIIAVRSYQSLGEMWREWGRSFDLKDATSRRRRWLDLLLVWSVQAMPLPVLLAIASTRAWHMPAARALLFVNVLALSVRLMMLVALRGSYAKRGAPFWLSWLADIPAAWRLTVSTLRVPRKWRGRGYASLAAID
jgi:dolichol-phosphate mannosyltransferase